MSTHGFTEVGERVWVARYEWYDVNITVVEGEAGLLVVDTHASTRRPARSSPTCGGCPPDR